MIKVIEKPVQAIKQFKQNHQGAYEFIMFNILSNIATITNFLVLNLSNSLIFKSLANRDFSFFVFDYSVENGGLAGFLSFLLSYAIAQVVNFIVQRKLVFNANNKLHWPIVIYALTVVGVYFICLYLPSLIIGPLAGIVGNFWATNIANMANIMVQVIIIYPVLKFVVMKRVPAEQSVHAEHATSAEQVTPIAQGAQEDHE